MGLNFVPSRTLMTKEIDQCIALDKLNPLLSICNSCALKSSSNRFEHECQNCKIQEAIYLISVRRQFQEKEKPTFA